VSAALGGAFAFFFAQDLFRVFECTLALRRKIFSGTILVEAEHPHSLSWALGRDRLLCELLRDFLCGFFE
jgi:hypothetical protein